MSTPEVPVQKTYASGTWRAIRSMAVPASVTSVHSGDSSAAHPSSLRPVKNVDDESFLLKKRKSPGYFETADPSFSKS